MQIILCPKCGKVTRYYIKEQVHRVTIYNENDECVDTTECEGSRFDVPRCEADKEKK